MEFAEVRVPGVWNVIRTRELDWERVVHFWFLPGAEMTAGICVLKQCLMRECSRAKCHATGYGISH